MPRLTLHAGRNIPIYRYIDGEPASFVYTFNMYKILTKHHAYLVTGELRALQKELISSIEDVLAVPAHGNPDFLILNLGTLVVDDARELQERASLRPLNERKVLVVGFSATTAEAQNALLKLLEEPLPGTYFFLVTPLAQQLLPTLRSRLMVLGEGSVRVDTTLARTFARASTAKRLALLAPLIEAKDRDAISIFCNGLEEVCAETQNHAGLEALYTAKKYLRDRGASAKLLLEGLALTFGD